MMIKKNVGAFLQATRTRKYLNPWTWCKSYCGKINGKSPHRCWRRGGSFTRLFVRFIQIHSLKDMDVAVSLVQETIENHKPIVIYGDYDVDGITATSVLYRF